MEEIYKEMYYKLLNAVSDTIDALVKKQQELEELYISQDDEKA